MATSKVDSQAQVSNTGQTDAQSQLRWHFARSAEHLRTGVCRVPWDDLAGCGYAQRVKVAENRDVWRIELPGRVIYAKCYRAHGLVKGMLETVRGLAAKREWRALRQASRLGVQAPDPVAYARADKAGKEDYYAVLVTAAMPADALSLEEAWLKVLAQGDCPAGRQRRDRIMHALAELIARAHAGGLFHRDLHVNNILIYANGHGPTAAMIDLHNARLCRSICLSGVRTNLVQLNQWFARHAGRTDRLRFLKAYCQCLHQQLPASERTNPTYGWKSLARRVLKQSYGYAARLHHKRDRRILQRNKYFASLQLGDGWMARVALDIKHGRPYEHALSQLPGKIEWLEILKDTANLLHDGPMRDLEDGPARRVVQTSLAFAGRPWAVVARYERRKSVLGQLTEWASGYRLQREFVTGWQCLHRELPVALPLAILHRGSGSLRESLLLVEQIPDSRDLDMYIRLQLPEMDGQQAVQVKRRVGLELARILRRMWSCRMVHRDLKATEIRLQIPGGDVRQLRLVLANVEGMIRRRWGVRRAILRSLARLDASVASCPFVTRTDRLRLLMAVLRQADHGKPHWKQAWRQIAVDSRRHQAVIAGTLPWVQPVAGAAAAQ